jgi:hypothetical protein
MLRVAVSAPLAEEGRGAEIPALSPVSPGGKEAETGPEDLPPPLPAPVTLAELYDRARGKRFGEKVHRVLEAFPPVTSPWPPEGSVPAEWEAGEEERWKGIVAAVRSSAFYRELCSARLVGTELPLLGFRAGRAAEDRADLVVRPEGAGEGGGEHWVVDYKTGPREGGQDEQYLLKVREYCSILAEAWGVPVRGILWYVESGEAVTVAPA